MTPRRSRVTVAFVSAVIASVALAGCSAPSDNGDASTETAPASASTGAAPAPSASATEEPEAPASTAEAITLSRDGFVILDDEGSDLFRYTWVSDAAPAVEALQEAFGEEPIVAVIAGDGTHYPDYTSYTWGGFTFFDWVDAGGKPRGEYMLPAFVQIVTADVDGIELRTDEGLQVGSPIADVIALEPTFSFPGYEVGEEFYFLDAPPSDQSSVSGPAIRVVVEGDVVTQVGYTYWSNI